MSVRAVRKNSNNAIYFVIYGLFGMIGPLNLIGGELIVKNDFPCLDGET